MDCYLDGWKKIFDFSSRTGRKGFFIFLITNFFFLTLLQNLMLYMGLSNLPILVVTFPFIFANIACITRRTHDHGRSGWMVFALLIPVINLWPFLWLMVHIFLPGNANANKYGEVPFY